MGVRECAATSCTTASASKGFCPKHYQRWKRHGSPDIVKHVHGDDAIRFWGHVVVSATESYDGLPCWVWAGEVTRSSNGDEYGRVSLVRSSGQRIRTGAHRWAYEAMVVAIPEDLQLDHLCKVTTCVNPWHLEPVPCRINLLRGDTLQAHNFLKTHCDSGHEFTPENTYRRPANGNRSCRACMRRWRQECAARRKVVA